MALELITSGPKYFIEKEYLHIPFPYNFDPISFYYQGVFPYLYNAFESWRDIVKLSGNNQIRYSLENSTQLKLIEKYSYGFIITYFGDIDKGRVRFPNDLLKLFPTKISNIALPDSSDELEEMLNAWWLILSRKRGWDKEIVRQPYVIDLSSINPITVAKLPKIIELGNYQMIRLMDSFYAPDKRGADWAKELFNYLGPEKFERMADLQFKKDVDLTLLTDIQGNVLDLGCGSGLLQLLANELGLSNLMILGIDISDYMLVTARKRGERVILGNIASMNAEEILQRFKKNGTKINFFNHAVMSYVDNWLTHEERTAIFNNLSHLILPGGFFNFNVYGQKREWEKYYIDLLIQSGFTKVTCFTKTLSARDGEKQIGFVSAEK